jgi:tRNA(adenine34) deaminase
MHGGTKRSMASAVDVDLTADEHGMREALAVATRGLERGELPIGAVVVADGQVLGSSHTEEVTQRRLLVHAELLALEKADRQDGWDRRNATLYTTLEPCVMCMGATATALVGRIVWAIESDDDLASRICREWDASRPLELPQLHLPEVVGPIGHLEAADLFRAYVEARGDSCDPFVRWAATLIGHERAVH